MVYEVLKGFYIKAAVVYIYDSVIYASVDSFLDVLNQVLLKMVQFNVRLKPSKYYFGMEEIEFLDILSVLEG
jgi:hypothetical protein